MVIMPALFATSKKEHDQGMIFFHKKFVDADRTLLRTSKCSTPKVKLLFKEWFPILYRNQSV